MAGKGGGAWKVAYADFVTAMMAFFLVMWITAQSASVKKAIAQYFKDPSVRSKVGGGAPLLPTTKAGDPPGPSIVPFSKGGSAIGVDRTRNSQDTPRGSGDKKSCLFVIHDGDRRYLGTMILFGEGSAELDDTGKERLLQLVGELRGTLQKIEIRGHAVHAPPAKESGAINPWQMSYNRCQAVMRFLVQNGIEPERLRLSQGGAYEPYTLQVDPSLKIYNSRVEVFVLDEYARDLMGTSAERNERFKAP
jgi:chemotaxis protein MotB